VGVVDKKFDRSRPKDMPGIPEASPEAGGRFEPVFKRDRPGLLPGGDRVLLGIDRHDLGLVGAVLASVAPRGVALLDATGVRKHEFEEGGGRLGAPDIAGETFRHEPWQQSAMVDMSMRQDNGIDMPRIERERAAIERLQRPGALEKTAVDEKTLSRMAEFHAGAGDRACRAMESECEFVGHTGSWVISSVGDRYADRATPELGMSTYLDGASSADTLAGSASSGRPARG